VVWGCWAMNWRFGIIVDVVIENDREKVLKRRKGINFQKRVVWNRNTIIFAHSIETVR
jgi:hypothetical protein